MLESHGASVYDTELLVAAGRGDLAPLKSWLDSGGKVDTKDAAGCTLLMGAAALANEPCVELLIQARANVDARDDVDATALVRAAMANSVPVVSRLLAANCDPALRTHENLDARGAAAARGCADVVRLLTPAAEAAASAPAPEDPRRGAVQALRERGNALFVKRDFAGAAGAYTEALQEALRGGVPASDSARILANRAACALKTGKPADALGDARLAVRLDPAYAKAHYRLACALEASGAAADAAEAMAESQRLEKGATTASPDGRTAFAPYNANPTGSVAAAGGAAAASGKAATSGEAAAGEAAGGKAALSEDEAEEAELLRQLEEYMRNGCTPLGAEAAPAAAPPPAPPAPEERVETLLDELRETLAGSEERRELVVELLALLEAADKRVTRAFVDAEGPQVLHDIESCMRGNWVGDAKNGTMSRISQMASLPGAPGLAIRSYRNQKNQKVENAASGMHTGCQH